MENNNNLDKLDKSLQEIDDTVQELIKEGVKLTEIETYIRLQCSTIFNRAFLAECLMAKEKKNDKR